MNIVIIGGSSDIGEYLAKYLFSLGNRVLVGYNSNKIDIDSIYTYKCNVLDEDSINNFFEYAYKLFGNIDVVINMGAICMDNSLLNKTKNEFMKVLETNVVGMFLCCQRYARSNDNGMIINIGSTDGIDTYSTYNLDYSVSKSGVILLSKVFKLGTKLDVFCVCPNWIDSNSTRSMDKDYLDSELKRIGQSRLIRLDEFNKVINDVINKKYNDTVIRLDIRDDNLWIEKVQ